MRQVALNEGVGCFLGGALADPFLGLVIDDRDTVFQHELGGVGDGNPGTRGGLNTHHILRQLRVPQIQMHPHAHVARGGKGSTLGEVQGLGHNEILPGRYSL